MPFILNVFSVCVLAFKHPDSAMGGGINDLKLGKGVSGKRPIQNSLELVLRFVSEAAAPSVEGV